ncbi:MAG TPA: VanZ family protein [Rhizomicrobium sp.]|nr:VanZ family protein [Rhizomicrobium sp.]
MWKAKFANFFRLLSLWLFWPGVAVIAWGEFTPSPPQLTGLLGWDKADHFIAYFGLAAMASLVIGLRPHLKWAILGVILLGGLLEVLQAFSGRDAEMLDFVANSLGALTGWALGALFLILFPRRGALVAAPASD